MEAISVPLVVGLSVDYCLHLGHAYNHAGEGDKSDLAHKPVTDRLARMRSALVSIGPSVVSAAITTIASMCVLIACDIHVFQEIGIIVSSTLVLGIYFSMCVFSALCMIWGPEHEQGNIVAGMKRCWRWGQQASNEDAVPARRLESEPSPELEYAHARLE
jgi:predicted RND superfamily exporter protein